MTQVGIYVQFPFCQTKCTYCNFHTGVVSSARFAPYVDAVCNEIKNHGNFYAGGGVVLPAYLADALVDTVYIGGGTPSLLDPAELSRILQLIRGTFSVKAGAGPTAPALGRGRHDVETTLEADPETIEREKAESWVAAGINRVSFGVQSFSDAELVATGRRHRRADIYRAVPILRAAGIRNISFDLIAGLPGQTPESWRTSLEEMAGLQPEHVSVYLLEVDDGSRLGAEVLRGGVRYGADTIPSDDQMAEFYETACAFLGRAGYRHYEISNWAKPGLESRHNLKYWRRQTYLGFGAGAHSFSGTQRWANAHDAAAYVAAVAGGKLPIEQLEVLTADGALEEELFLGLRQLEGIDLERIEQEYGVAVASRFDRLMTAGLVERNGSIVRLAPEKLSVSNEVFVELMK
jgi:oxygen-independent coproporphyrinogen-3 oxidase